MQAARPGGLQSAINVTPLVDVVLVLLIIFMVVAPQLQAGPDVTVPTTEKPEAPAEDAARLMVTIQADGTFWLDDRSVEAHAFPDAIHEAASIDPDRQVLIRADATLSFGAVKQAMWAVEAAGFGHVSLVTEAAVAGE